MVLHKYLSSAGGTRRVSVWLIASSRRAHFCVLSAINWTRKIFFIAQSNCTRDCINYGSIQLSVTDIATFLLDSDWRHVENKHVILEKFAGTLQSYSLSPRPRNIGITITPLIRQAVCRLPSCTGSKRLWSDSKIFYKFGAGCNWHTCFWTPVTPLIMNGFKADFLLPHTLHHPKIYNLLLSSGSGIFGMAWHREHGIAWHIE